MTRIIVINNLSLDGVTQAPGRPDEDLRGGFRHGGWAAPYDAMGSLMGARTGRTDALLLGRRTYQDFAGFWPTQQDNPFTPVFDAAPKYVASRTLTEPLEWRNSTLLKGDAADAVGRLRDEPGGDIVVLGSGELVRSLARHRLVDEYVLLIHPLVLGSGARLFPHHGRFAALRLLDSTTTPTGVLIARYQPTTEGGE